MVKCYLIAHGHTEQSVEQLDMQTKMTLIRMFSGGKVGPIQGMLNNYRTMSMVYSLQNVVITALGGRKSKHLEISDTHSELFEMVGRKKTMGDKIAEMREKWYGSS